MMINAAGWVDVTRVIRPGMVVWPGDPPVHIRRVFSIGPDCHANVTAFSMSAHAGTHLDVPLHFIEDGAGFEAVALEALMGEARVLRIDDPRAVTRGELERHGILPGERILLQTLSGALPVESGAFHEDFVYLSAEAARFLVERGVRTVGIDYLSVGGFRVDNEATHRALLGAGICVIENLDLRAVQPGLHEMICLPLLLAGSDGLPARVLLRPLQG